MILLDMGMREDRSWWLSVAHAAPWDALMYMNRYRRFWGGATRVTGTLQVWDGVMVDIANIRACIEMLNRFEPDGVAH